MGWQEFLLPISTSVLLGSVPKHLPEPTPVAWQCRMLKSTLAPPLSFMFSFMYYSRIWVCTTCILTSCRAICWMRSALVFFCFFVDWIIRGAAMIFNISVTKSNDGVTPRLPTALALLWRIPTTLRIVQLLPPLH